MHFCGSKCIHIVVQPSPPATSRVASSCKTETHNLLDNGPSPSASTGNHRPTLHGPNDSRDLVEAESYSTGPFVTGQFMQHGVYPAYPRCSCIKASSLLTAGRSSLCGQASCLQSRCCWSRGGCTPQRLLRQDGRRCGNDSWPPAQGKGRDPRVRVYLPWGARQAGVVLGSAPGPWALLGVHPSDSSRRCS